MGTAKSPFQTLIERAASSYIAGPTIASARLVCERLASSGIASTVCYWNRPSDSPLHTTERYLGLLDLIQDLPAGSYLSVKAPALGFDMKLIEQVLDEAHHLAAREIDLLQIAAVRRRQVAALPERQLHHHADAVHRVLQIVILDAHCRAGGAEVCVISIAQLNGI